MEGRGSLNGKQQHRSGSSEGRQSCEHGVFERAGPVLKQWRRMIDVTGSLFGASSALVILTSTIDVVWARENACVNGIRKVSAAATLRSAGAR